MQVADNAEPLAKEFNEEQLQPAAEYIAKNFEKEARRLAKEVGPLAEGLPKAMRRAVELNKVHYIHTYIHAHMHICIHTCTYNTEYAYLPMHQSSCSPAHLANMQPVDSDMW